MIVVEYAYFHPYKNIVLFHQAWFFGKEFSFQECHFRAAEITPKAGIHGLHTRGVDLIIHHHIVLGRKQLQPQLNHHKGVARYGPQIK